MDTIVSVSLPEPLRRRLERVARLRDSDLPQAILWVLEGYTEEAIEEADDMQHAAAIMARVEAGTEGVYTQEEAWAMLRDNPDRESLMFRRGIIVSVVKGCY